MECYSDIAKKELLYSDDKCSHESQVIKVF